MIVIYFYMILITNHLEKILSETPN